MGDAEDFWPAIEETESPNSPVVLLRKQAERLTDKTDRRLRERVSTLGTKLDFHASLALGILDGRRPDSFTHIFSIEIPALDDYSYTLFSISHLIEGYPVLYQDDDGSWQRLSDVGQFTAWLKQTLSSDKTKRILRTLLEQAGK
jgi:hypothetical protein